MRYKCHPHVKKMPSWARLGLGFNLISTQSFVNRETGKQLRATPEAPSKILQDSAGERIAESVETNKKTQPSLACAWVSPCCRCSFVTNQRKTNAEGQLRSGAAEEKCRIFLTAETASPPRARLRNYCSEPIRCGKPLSQRQPGFVMDGGGRHGMGTFPAQVAEPVVGLGTGPAALLRFRQHQRLEPAKTVRF
jgi:hypothetical protein